MDEFNSGHLKGSINIDFYEEKLFDKFPSKLSYYRTLNFLK